MKYVTRHIPVFQPTSENVSVYRNVLIAWDNFKDVRILDFIDDMKKHDRNFLLMAKLREGQLELLWRDIVPDKYEQGTLVKERNGDCFCIMESVGAHEPAL